MTTPYPVPPAVEEPLGAVTRVLALTEDPDGGNGADSFTGRSLPQLSGRIYGGQVVAQGLLAAAATMIDDGDGARLPHSVHAYFMRGGEPDEPLRFDVERLHDGRSFSQRRTTASQNGVPILAMISSFQERQAGADVQLDPPEVPGPDELVSSLEIFRTLDHPVAKFLGRTAAFDLRHILGKTCLLGISHVEKNGKTYANIASISNKMRGYEPPAPHNEVFAFDLDKPDYTVFEKLSEKLKETIRLSPEWAELNPPPAPPQQRQPETPGAAPAQPAQPVEDFDDDIPF